MLECLPSLVEQEDETLPMNLGFEHIGEEDISNTSSVFIPLLIVTVTVEIDIESCYLCLTLKCFLVSHDLLLLKDGKAVDTLEGADPSSLANKVGKIAGSSTSSEPASLGLAARPTILETVKENAKATVKDRAQPAPTTENLNDRLEKFTNSHPVMLFMKGTPEEPRCGFSRQVVGVLREENVDFGSFDILSDNQVREGLKKFSNWPTFPQLYCNGELLGGSDIVLEMQKSGELRQVLSEKGKQSLEDRLKTLINSEKVMLFMKGSPDEPKCGFSSKVVKALRDENVSFGSFDILSDEEVRQGIKSFSNWPTFPQLYYKGELVGGCDIIMELSNSGDLGATLSE